MIAEIYDEIAKIRFNETDLRDLEEEQEKCLFRQEMTEKRLVRSVCDLNCIKINIKEK